MTKKRKSLGFTELQWICSFCEGVNRGTVRVCGNCSAPQGSDVEFLQPTQERLIVEEAEVASIKGKSADIHCAYCGTRNDPTNKTCTRCLADLSEGETRQAGDALGAHRHKKQPDVSCPSCGTTNPATAAKCANCLTPLRTVNSIAAPAIPSAAPTGRSSGSNMVMIAVIGVALIACVAFFILSQRTTEVIGRVQAVEWQRSIPILALGPVEYDTWWDQVPNDGDVLMCEDRVRYSDTVPDPDRLSLEVCGTPYTVDQGNGFGEVVQDCEYEIYDDWCEYVVDEWTQVNIVTAQGDSFAAYWPDVPDSAEFRTGDANEQYEVQFRADGTSYVYSTSSYNEFEAVQSSDNWVLDVNTFGSVRSISPAR